IDPVFNLRGGRSLPLPPSLDDYDGFLVRVADSVAISWPIPKLFGPIQILMWLVLLLGSIVLLGLMSRSVRRREPGAFRGVVLAVVTAFALGILPQGLQRPDPTHLAWVSCVPFGFLPVAGVELVRLRRPDLTPWRWFVAGAA